jgi:Tfp pilus assembly protein PilN
MEFRISNLEFRIGVLNKHIELVSDLKKTIEAMEWEKQTLMNRLAKINAVLDSGY